MRIVAWNCNGGFHRKIDALMALRPDVAVISECAEPELLAARGPMPEMPCPPAWIGRNRNKGLGIFALGDSIIQTLPRVHAGLHWILPVEVHGPARFNLLGVWAQNASAGIRKKANPGPLRESLAFYRGFLGAAPAVAAGDFNNHILWDKPDWRMNHADAVVAMEELGMVSGYHAHRGIAQGAEREPTHYWRDRTKEGPTYHIDYIFLPATWLPAMTGFEVGSFEDWCGNGLSDHVPLVAEVDLQTEIAP